MRYEEYRIGERKFDARGRILPSIGCWRPYDEENKNLSKIEKGILPPPSVINIEYVKPFEILRKNDIKWFSTMLRIKDMSKTIRTYGCEGVKYKSF